MGRVRPQMIVKSAGYYVYRTHTIAAHEPRTDYNSPRDPTSQDFNDFAKQKLRDQIRNFSFLLVYVFILLSSVLLRF